MLCRLTGHLNDCGCSGNSARFLVAVETRCCRAKDSRDETLRQSNTSANRQVDVEEAAGEPEAPTNMCFTRIVYLLVRLAGLRLQPAPVCACVHFRVSR